MSLADKWLQELKLSEEQLQEIIRMLQPVVERHDNRAPYDVIEAALKDHGIERFDAQKVLAVLYARHILTDSINSWDYKPFNLVKYMQLIEN